MTPADARALLEHWQECPPENEMLAILARVYTTWRPAAAKPQTVAEHRASLEARWNNGAMNAEQLFKATGGALSLVAGAVAPRTGVKMPGIGDFPGISR